MGRPYSVQRGDSLTAIARRFGLKSWQDLYNSPDNSAFRAKRPNPNLIFPGDVIVIPEQRPDKPAATISPPPISPPPISPVGKDTGPFSRNNTDLGKFSHGNFDVAYDPKKATLQVTLKVTYRFEKAINPDAQTKFKLRLQGAVQAWDNAGAYLRSKGPVLNPIIRIHFQLQEVAGGAHFPIDVEKSDRREWVGYDLNVCESTSTQTLIHELGHVFGNYDEYKGRGLMGWIERRMYWHDNAHLGDTNDLMNSGAKFQSRYFDHFARYVNQQFAKLRVSYEPNLE